MCVSAKNKMTRHFTPFLSFAPFSLSFLSSSHFSYSHSLLLAFAADNYCVWTFPTGWLLCHFRIHSLCRNYKLVHLGHSLGCRNASSAAASAETTPLRHHPPPRPRNSPPPCLRLRQRQPVAAVSTAYVVAAAMSAECVVAARRMAASPASRSLDRGCRPAGEPDEVLVDFVFGFCVGSTCLFALKIGNDLV